MVAFKLYETATTTVAQSFRLYETATQTGTPNQKFRLFETATSWYSASAPSNMSVSAGGDVTGIEPFDTVNLTATTADSPETYLWQQISGPAVQILSAVDSATCQYEAVPDPDGATLVFQVTITKTGEVPASDTVTHSVLPHTVWTRDINGNLAPLIASIGT